jgi:hypothetical protein
MHIAVHPIVRSMWPALAATFAVTIALSAQQAAPTLLPFQGRLTDPNGNAVSDGARLIQFQIYDQPTSGSAVWAGEVHRTTVNGGLVNVLLGSKNPFPKGQPAAPDKPFFDQMLYLQITVDSAGAQDGGPDGQITAADPPLLPRQVILPTTFAKESQNSAKLAGYDWSTILADGSANPQTGKIAGAKIADSTITSRQIAKNSIEKEDLGSSVAEELDDILQQVKANHASITNLAAGIAELKADIASLSNCCVQLQMTLQAVHEDLKNPWVLFATTYAGFYNLSADEIELPRWEYGVTFNGTFLVVSARRVGEQTWLISEPAVSAETGINTGHYVWYIDQGTHSVWFVQTYTGNELTRIRLLSGDISCFRRRR